MPDDLNPFLELIDRLSEAEAKHLLKMLISTNIAALDAVILRTEGRL